MNIQDEMVRRAVSIYTGMPIHEDFKNHYPMQYFGMKAVLDDLQSDRSAVLEEAATLIDEGFDKDVGKAWRNDGEPSKNDMCPHDKFMYEDCERCAAAAIRALKSQPSQTGGDRHGE